MSQRKRKYSRQLLDVCANPGNHSLMEPKRPQNCPVPKVQVVDGPFHSLLPRKNVGYAFHHIVGINRGASGFDWRSRHRSLVVALPS